MEEGKKFVCLPHSTFCRKQILCRVSLVFYLQGITVQYFYYSYL